MIVIQCDEFWNCLTPSDWFQLIAVIIAMFAAVASYLSVLQSRKQFKEESEDRKKKYRPIFKIKKFNISDTKTYWFDIINEGFPYCVITQVKWVGVEGVSIEEHFIGEITREIKGEVQEKYESFLLMIRVDSNTAGEGYFEINGFDIEHNSFSLKSPSIEIKSGKIVNGVQVTYQYLR